MCILKLKSNYKLQAFEDILITVYLSLLPSNKVIFYDFFLLTAVASNTEKILK